MAEKISKPGKKINKFTKRPSKSQRIHTRRVKQLARDAGSPHH